MKDDLDFEATAKTFYEVLFREAPAAQALFKDDTSKIVMLVNALESIASMERGDGQLTDFMAMLGDQHRKYGVTQEFMHAGWKAFNAALDVGATNVHGVRRQFYENAFLKLVAAMGFDPSSFTR